MKLGELYKYYQGHPEGNWIMEFHITKLLYDYVKEKKPKKILELGTGIGLSTACIALALQGEDYEIHTFEQFEKCTKIAKEIIPKEFKNIEFHNSESVVWNTDKIPYQNFSVYEKMIEGEFDMIVVDGPGPFEKENHLLDLPNGDIIKMLLEDKIKPNTFIAWDKRIKSLMIVERYFSDNFYLDFSQSNFNVIQRKTNKVIFRDEKYEVMKDMGYFDDKDNKSK